MKNRRYLIFFLIQVLYTVIFRVTLYADNLGNDEKIKKNIEAILSSKEFTNKSKNKGVIELLTSMIKDIYRWFQEKFSNLNISMPSGTFLNREISPQTLFLVKILASATICAMVAYLLYFIFKNVKISKRIKNTELSQLLTKLKDPEEVQRRALEYSKIGDFRQAIRFLYISLLLYLNEINIIKINETKTNKQYLNEVMDSGFQWWKLIADFTNIFNVCWYGNKDIDKKKFDFWYEKYAFLIKETEL